MSKDFSNYESIKQAPFLYKGYTGWPDFSPDGKSIVFTTNADHVECSLTIIDVKYPNAFRQLTSPELGAKRPTWHPDGQLIAYNLNNESIWVVNLENNESKPYLSDEVRNGRKLIHPCYSPDGNTIIAASLNRGGPQRDEVLYRLTPFNQDPIEEITAFPNVCAGRNAVSPNGKDIIFAGHAGFFNQLENRLWKVTPPGKAYILESGDDASCHGRCPAYSPDGRWVACVSARPEPKPSEDTPMGVWIIRSDGSKAYKLTDGSLLPTHMAWSPDQLYIAITSAHGLQLIELPELFRNL